MMLTIISIYAVLVTFMLCGVLLLDGQLWKILKVIGQIRKIIEVLPRIAQTADTIGGSAVNRIFTLDDKLAQLVANVDQLSSQIGKDNVKFQNWLLFEKEKEAARKREEEKALYEKLEKEYLDGLAKKQADSNHLVDEDNRNISLDNSETIGNFDGNVCPLCKQSTLSNKLGQRWCPNVSCNFGENIGEEPETDIIFEFQENSVEEIILQNYDNANKEFSVQRKKSFESSFSKDFGSNKIDLSEIINAKIKEETITR